jgi:phosphate transport system substrate-binding protein
VNQQSDRVGARTRLAYLLGALVVAVAALVVFSACNNDDDDGDAGPTATSGGPTATTGGIDYDSLSGSIRIDGSSTVFPITAAAAEDFRSVASGVNVNVALSGTGGGFELFCANEIPISDASRPIEQDEIDACASAGITDYIELQVAIDALTVMVNPSNDFIDCLTVEQLAMLFSDTSVTQWSDVDPSWPAEDIVFYYPGTDSGTFDYFVEAIVEGVDENAAHRGDGFASENDNDLVIGIENDANAIGYFGFAYYQEAGQELKAVSIDAGAGCVEPTFENALDGTYAPLSRPLFIYTRESLLAERPEVLGFVNFYLENTATLVPEVGYVTMPDELLQEQFAKIASYLP